METLHWLPGRLSCGGSLAHDDSVASHKHAFPHPHLFLSLVQSLVPGGIGSESQWYVNVLQKSFSPCHQRSTEKQQLGLKEKKKKEKKDGGSRMDLLLAMSYYSEYKLKGMAVLVVCSINQHAEAPAPLGAVHPSGKRKFLPHMTFLGEKHGTKIGAKQLG